MNNQVTHTVKRAAAGMLVLFMAVTPVITQKMPVQAEVKRSEPVNPVHHCTKDTDPAGTTDKTDWSYIYFGSYPQREVTGAALTDEITGASYDTDGDAWVNGVRYRRISRKNTNSSFNFGNVSYSYFKWEKIRWKVLENNGSALFLAADQGLDSRKYDEVGEAVTWEDSGMRGWLNSEFYRLAFNSGEQNVILEHTLTNENNTVYGTAGGNNTQDKVFLLSAREVVNPAYGFCSDGAAGSASASRQVLPSDYAVTRGAWQSYRNLNCSWWLRSPGDRASYVANVGSEGEIGNNGDGATNESSVVVPAICIDKTSELWESAGNGEAAVDTPASGQTETEQPDFSGGENAVKVQNIKIHALSKKVAAGKKIRLSAEIMPQSALCRNITWSVGTIKYATVDSRGVVTTKKAGKGKSVTVTAAAADGSGVKASVRLRLMKNAVTKVKILRAPKTLKTGKSVRLKADVRTDGKSANKTLLWTSSDSRYAVVTANGTVTAKKAGKGKYVKITAAATDGTGKTADVRIKIR